MRYEFAITSLSVVVPAKPETPAAAALVDLHPTINGDATGVTLDFPAYDPAAYVAPIETRAYWIVEGLPALGLDAPTLVASATPCSQAAVEVPVTGLTGIVLPTPDNAYPPAASPDARYVVKVVLGFND